MSDRECVNAITKAMNEALFARHSYVEKAQEAESILREHVACATAGAQQEIRHLQGMVNGFADHIAAAHEVIAKRAEKDDRHELVALIGVLWQHAEPSIRHDDIRQKVACVLSTAGNVRRKEKPT